MTRSVRLGAVADVNWGNTAVTKKAYVQQGFQAYSASGPDGFVDWAEHDTPGVVVSAIGAQCGKTWYAQGQWTPIKNTLWFRSTDPEVETRFLYYATADPSAWPRRGAAQPFISKGDAQDLPLMLPALETQRAVVMILRFFDDLIENNQRRIKILEEMARLSYRTWFMHFRYPGHEGVELADSDLGPIPREWRVRRLGEILELSYGKALRASDRMGGPVVVYGSGGQVGWHNEALVSGPGIVVGRKGNVGSVYWTERDFFPIDTTYYVQSDLPFRFLDQLLRTLPFVDSHAAVPGLSREQAYGLVVAEPDHHLLSQYETAVQPMYRLRHTLSDQANVLHKARDLLLPRLISGELDVSALDLDLAAV